MGIELAKAFIKVRADSSQVASDFKKGKGPMEGAARGMASSVNRILATIGVGVGMTALISKMNEFVALAERQIQAEQRVAAVVRATGAAAGFTARQLTEQAAALQSVTTVGDEEILELQAIILTFRAVTGDTFKETTELALDLAAVLGTDAKSGALQLGKALEDPIRGVTALRRAGVSFSEEMKAQIKILQESNQLQGAQDIVLGEVKKQIGGVAKELAKTDAGKLQQARNVLGDMREELGRRLIPLQQVFVKLQMKLLNVLGPVIEKLAKHLSLILKLGGALIAAKVAIIAVNLAIAAYTAATKAASVSTAFLMALSGPAGWAKLTAGIIAAGVAIGTMNQALKESEEEARKTAKNVEEADKQAGKLAASMERVAAGFTTTGSESADILGKVRQMTAENRRQLEGIEEWEEQTQNAHKAIRKAMEENHKLLTTDPAKRAKQFRELESQAANLNAEMNELNRVTDELNKKKSIDKFVEKVNDLHDEIQQMTLGLSDFEMMLRKMAKQPGMTETHLDTMRRLNEQVVALEKVKAKREEDARAREDLIQQAKKPLLEFATRFGMAQAFAAAGMPLVDVPKAGKKAQAPAATLSGRTGFANFGGQLQDLLMGKKSDRQREQMIDLLQKANQNDKIIIREIGRNRVAVLD